MKGKSPLSAAFDFVCCLSVVGVWPRFIEPSFLRLTSLHLPIPNLPPALSGMKILQFSDLHFSPSLSNRLLEKLQSKITALAPDLLLFTGDFLCHTRLEEKERLHTLLKSFRAPLGAFASLGNHDYTEPLHIDREGNYAPGKGSLSHIASFTPPPITGYAKAKLPPHPELVELLKESPFELLHNQVAQVEYRGSSLNIVGLGDLMAGQFSPKEAFETCDARLPTFVLTHHPDTITSLSHYPADVILSGHTHGSQINLPWVRERINPLQNPQFARGLHRLNGRWAYINRGISATLRLRLFSPPELLLITLEREP